jgi:hypothetical protein
MAETDHELRKIVSEFREGILDGGDSAFMCIAVCSPLEGYLRHAHGIETHAVAGTIDLGEYNMEHFWLEMDDGTVIDPTADQFKELRLPPVYIGARPKAYLVEGRMKELNVYDY